MYSFMGEKRKQANLRICKNIASFFIIASIAALATTTSYAAGFSQAKNVSRETFALNDEKPVAETVNPKKQVLARVTGYNTVAAQTDNTPCIAASGDNICGRTDVVACPRNLALGSKVEIDGKTYTCLDRTNSKFNGRFDISCDKDMKCPGRVTGNKLVTIIE